MKKQLLVSLAVVGTMSAMAAAPKADVGQRVKFDTKGTVVRAQQATAQDLAKRQAPSANVQYRYPKGAYYSCNMDIEQWGYGYMQGTILLHPYASHTYTNISTATGEPQWNWFQYVYDQNQGKNVLDSLTQKGGDELTVDYSLELVKAPAVSVGRYSFGRDSYWYSAADGTGLGARRDILAAAVPNLSVSFNQTMPVSGGWYCFVTRQGGVGSMITYSGNTKEDGSGEEFWWWGTGSRYDACGGLFLAPAQPYSVKGGYLAVRGYATEDVELTVKIYKVLKGESFKDTVNSEGEPAKMYVYPQLGEVIAEGKATFPKTVDTADEHYSEDFQEWWGGVLPVKFQVTDDFGTYEVTPEIDSDIMVVVTGYQQPAMKQFSFNISQDNYYDGQGSRAYCGYSVGETTDKPELLGLMNFFRSTQLPGSFGILLDMDMPFLIANYANCPDSYEVPAEGGAVEPVQGTEAGPLQLYSYESSENWSVTQEDGSDLPSWITVEPSDEANEEGEFSGLVKVFMDVEKLPEGEAGRGVKVKFSYPGASYVFTVTQGDYEFDAVEGIESDSETVAKEYYNLQGQKLNAAPENGVYILKSIKADGSYKSVKVAK